MNFLLKICLKGHHFADLSRHEISWRDKTKIKNLIELFHIAFKGTYSGKYFFAFGTGENTSKLTRRRFDGEKHLLHSQHAESDTSQTEAKPAKSTDIKF